jgi:hypothetical protein
MNASKYRARAIALLVGAANVVAINTAGTAAASNGPTLVPFLSVFRNCSFQQTYWVSATGSPGSGDALIGAGSDGATADVRLATAEPNTRYTVRLIQVPRASERTCTAGDPGVAVGELFTDGSGTGSARVQGALMQGATGAWVSVDGPPKPGKVIGEFYTSELLAPLA